jgi:diguanylate cyclase (GGDEF)-like protein
VLYDSRAGVDEQVLQPRRRQFDVGIIWLDRVLKDEMMSATFQMSPSATELPDLEDSSQIAVKAAPRLLIVDDIGDNRTILTRRFQRRGFEIVEAESGLQALALIESQSFDLVMLDVMMPGIDGLETLRRIRKQKSSVLLPVIMVTAKSESDNVVEALNLGANDYVTKPVDFSVAMARVNAQLSRRKAELELLEANRRLTEEIASRVELEERSHYLAYHDVLTGLGNRLLFKDHLEKALKDGAASQHPVAVISIDLDGFKAVNETLGHSIGDMLLRSVAARLRDMLPQSDQLARLGGDEFAILQTSVAQPDASISLAEKIIESLSQPWKIEGHDLSVGASVGIALNDPVEISAENLLKSADQAMHQAKADGRGTYRMFDPAMDESAQARRILERDLRTALAQNQFRLYYQPLVNLTTKKVRAFEALLRWQHPVRGLVPPTEFIAAAEQLGLIIPLGEWALRQACAEAMQWPAEICVSVNLSPLQFAKGNLVATVVSALASSGLPASRLDLEITESVLLDASAGNLAILNQLRELGVRISMDDFGTGYSSIGYLRSFNFDKLKIDQSFIRDLLVDDGSQAIVRAIMGLGTSFGMTVIAEGVETKEQMERLGGEGCIEVQGYLYSRPVPADEIKGLLDQIRDQNADPVGR